MVLVVGGFVLFCCCGCFGGLRWLGGICGGCGFLSLFAAVWLLCCGFVVDVGGRFAMFVFGLVCWLFNVLRMILVGRWVWIDFASLLVLVVVVEVVMLVWFR